MNRARRWVGLGAVLALAGGCGAACPPSVSGGSAEGSGTMEQAGQVLDAWHAAAAASDEEAYFGLLTEDSIFLGTDATERWTKAEFRAYAHPHFTVGRGWVFRSVRRDVVVAPDGRLAWFDEDLDTEGLGPARGSGVLRLEPEGWRIVQYNLALTIPNERFARVREALESELPADAEPPERP